MIKIKTTNTPIHLPNQYNTAKGTNPPTIPSSSEVPSKEDNLATNSSPIVASIPASQPVTSGSNKANAQTASATRPILPTNVRDFVNDKVSALLSGSYQQSVANNPTQKSTKPAVVNKNDINPIQAYEWEKIKGLLSDLQTQTKGNTSSTNVKQTTAGKPSTSVGPLNVRPFGMSFPAGNGQAPSDTTGIPSEYADLAKVVASLPDGFDLTGWDDKTTREQRSAMQRSGLNGQEQMQLLNARTSIETIALVQDIQRNRLAYGLSYTDVSDISKQLFDITNARIGAKNHAMPFSENATSTRLFLSMLDEKENALLSAFGYGVESYAGKRDNINDIRGKITDLVTGDSSISDTLYNNPDVLNTPADFFSDMTKLDTLIGEVQDGTISFRNTAEKQRYLDYLTSEYSKNDQLYRQRLASFVDDAKLLEYPETRFKKLINDLSLPQLAVFADQVDQLGVRRLSKAGNYERLMRAILSDKDIALSVSADDTESPIRPYVWSGNEVITEKEIQISGFYYKNGHYYTEVSKAGKSHEIDLGNKIPSAVTIEAVRATEWDMFGDQIRLLMEICATPAFVVDAAYNFAVYNGVPAFLPAGLSPSDLPFLGELLDKIDPWSHTAHIQKETVSLRIVTHHLNTSENEYKVVQFDTINAE